jgi:hypothetical protein
LIQPQPFDATYESQIGLNQRNLQNTNTGLDQEQSGLIRSYGLDDPTDPFSQLHLLQRSFENRKRGNTNSYASSGQLYSGALQNAQNSAQYGYDQGYDQLRKGQNTALSGIANRRAAASSAFEQGNIDAGQAALDRALQTPVDPATLPPPKSIKAGKGTTYNRVARKRKKFNSTARYS